MTSKLKPVPAYQEFKSYKDVDLAIHWRWPNFTPEEIACRGTGKLVIHAAAMDKLQHLRTLVGKPLILNSAYRSPEHNKRVGGEANSYHMAKRTYEGEGVMAFDVSMANHEPYAFMALAKKAGFRGFGQYPLTKDGRRNFVHIDNGPPRTWNLGGVFAKPSEKPTAAPQRFDSEPAKPNLVESLLKPEVAVPVGTLIAGTGMTQAVQDPTNPIAWVIAGGLLIAIVIAGIYTVNRIRSKMQTTMKGESD